MDLQRFVFEGPSKPLDKTITVDTKFGQDGSAKKEVKCLLYTDDRELSTQPRYKKPSKKPKSRSLPDEE